MANVVLSCLACSSELGCFRNSWIGIGNSYFSPAYPPVTYINGFEPSGSVFAKGPDGSAVQNSVLQDLTCRKCATVVGLICNDAPTGSVLKKNQLILRLAEMHVVSEQTGEKATISVQEKIPLVAPGTKKAVRRAATLQPMSRHQTPNLLVRSEEHSSISATMPPPAQTIPVNEVARFSNWADDAVKSQQKDIDRISGAVDRIEKDMKSLNDFMVEMRAELEANRVTRKTQQELSQSQLAWLQEDLKELRQENGDFQQDLREEELPDIRNQLDQLRQEIDSQEQMTGSSNRNGLPVSVQEFRGELLVIRRKAYEVDELKLELQKLQKRLNNVEKSQGSFTFPGSIMSSNQSSQAGSRMASLPTTAQPQMMLQALEYNGVQSMIVRQASPTRITPGAISGLTTDATPHNAIKEAANNAVSTRERNHRTAGSTVVVETTSPKSSLTQRWSYTGVHQWQSVKTAFQAFGLEYPKLGFQYSVKVLEDHVNNSDLQNSALARKYGEVSSMDGDNEDVEHEGPPELPEQESSPLKRKHDQDQGAPSEPVSEKTRKRMRRVPKATEVEKGLTDLHQILGSPSLNPSEGSATLTVPFVHGSPELGRDSRFRSFHSDQVLTDLTNRVQISDKSHDGASNRLSETLQSQPHSSNQETNAHTFHRRQISRDELDTPQPLANHRTPASKNRNDRSNPNTHVLLNYIEMDQTSIPGAFPSDLIDIDPAESNTQPAGAYSEAIAIDLRTDRTSHFKCGSCGKKYRNPSALRYHKNHSSCNIDPRDVTPTKFKCPYCNRELRFGGLASHLAHAICEGSENIENNNRTPTVSKKQKEKDTLVTHKRQTRTEDQEQKRKDLLAARERLVKAALEKEMQ